MVGDNFATCCVLHNMMLSEMVHEASPPWLQCGSHLASKDGMWLEGPSQPCAPVPVDASSKQLKLEFDCYWILLSYQLSGWRAKNPKTTSIDWLI
jgi:hypothetical protein